MDNVSQGTVTKGKSKELRLLSWVIIISNGSILLHLILSQFFWVNLPTLFSIFTIFSVDWLNLFGLLTLSMNSKLILGSGSLILGLWFGIQLLKLKNYARWVIIIMSAVKAINALFAIYLVLISQTKLISIFFLLPAAGCLVSIGYVIYLTRPNTVAQLKK